MHTVVITNEDGELIFEQKVEDVEDLGKVWDFLHEKIEEHDEDDAKIDHLMRGETQKLERFVGARQPPRYTQIMESPVYDPYEYENPVHLGGLNDPFGDMTDEELAALSDEEFAAMLRKAREEKE